MAKYLDKEGLETYEVTVKGRLQNKQDKLESGTNIKTINNTSLLGSGNINITSGGGTMVDMRVNNTSVVDANNVGNIVTETAYDASTNKIATMSDVPDTSSFIDKDVNNLTNYSLTTTLQTNKSITKGVEYIVGTQGSDTNAWKGTSTDTGCSSGAIYTGKMIMYHLPKAGTSSAATLNLTLPDGSTTGAKNIYRLASTTVTTNFAAGCDIFMVYDGTQWKINAYVDTSGSNTIGYQLRTNSAIWTNKTGYNVKRYVLLFEVDGGLSGAATTIKTETSKTTVNFKYIPGGVIKYYSTNESIANNSNFATTGLWDQYAVNLGYTFNTGSTLESGKPVYMRCTVNSDGTLTPNYSGTPSHPIVQALPSTADGKVYVYLGQAYSTTNMELYMRHPIFEYKNGKIREYVPTIAYSEISGTPTLATVATSGDYTDLSNTPSLATVATSGSYSDLTNKPTIPTNVSDLNNDSGFITSYTETDPVFTASAASGITSSNISDWNAKMKSSHFTGDIRIMNLDDGVYICDSANKKLYYYGTSDTTKYLRITTGTIIVVSGDSSRKTFIVTDGISSYYGYSTTSAGSYEEMVDVDDIVDSLTSTSTDKPLSAAQGKALKDLIDGLATVASTGAYSDLSGTPTLATVATSGDYDDLLNKPTIPTVPVTDVQVNSTSILSSGTANFVTNTAYDSSTNPIATMSDLPTNTSDLNNDSNFAVTNADNSFTAGQTIKGEVVVNSIRTKNLFDYRASRNGAITSNSTSETLDFNTYSLTSDWIPCEPNTTYTMSGSYNRSRWQTKAANGTITFLAETGATQTTGANAKYLRVYYYYDSNNIVTYNTVTDIQIEKGNTATAFTAFQDLTPNVSDTGWIKATLTSNFAEYSTGTNPQFRKIGKIVFVRGAVKTTTSLSSSNPVTMFTLPSGFRPSYLQHFAVCQGSGMNRWLMTIETNGAVAISRYGTTSYANIATTDWLPFETGFPID